MDTLNGMQNTNNLTEETVSEKEVSDRTGTKNKMDGVTANGVLTEHIGIDSTKHKSDAQKSQMDQERSLEDEHLGEGDTPWDVAPSTRPITEGTDGGATSPWPVIEDKEEGAARARTVTKGKDEGAVSDRAVTEGKDEGAVSARTVTGGNEDGDAAGAECPNTNATEASPATTLCQICEAAERCQPASNYCITCGCVLCLNCCQVHQKHSPDTEHALISVTPKTIHSISCSRHQDQLFRVFCLTCNEPLCKVCLSEEHTQHKMCDFTSKKRPDDAVVKGISWQIQNQMKELRALKRDLTTALEVMEKNRKETNDLILEEITKQMQWLQDKKQELVDRSDSYHREVRDHISRQERLVDKAASTMTDLQTRVDTSVYPLPPHGQITPEVFPAHVIQKLFTQIVLPHMLSKDFGVRDCCFQPGAEPDPGTLHSGESAVTRVLTIFNDAEIGKRKVKVLWNKAIEVHDVHFITNQSKDLLCTDMNKGYKLLKLKCDGKLSSLPVGLSGFSGRECAIGVNQVTGHKVVAYKLDVKSSNIVLTILTDGASDVDVNLIGATLPPGNTMMSGVALSQTGNVIVVSMDSPENRQRTAISCYTSSGSTLWQRNTSPSSFAGDLENPAFVVIDQLDRIIVSDSDGRKVNIYTSDGSHLLSFPKDQEDNQNIRPTGVAVDSRGRILVAFHDLQAVGLFTSNGDFIRHLVQTEGRPWGMSLSEDRFLVIALEDLGLWLYDLKDLD